MIYKHIRNNKPYLKLLNTKIKINGVWVKGVIYLCLYINKEGMIWVRTEEDFKKEFK